jgi:tRNA threonylcarbamoyladenosine biosynthesis protein TsaE
VTSPSYTLLNIHQGRFPFYHFDLYRLAQVDDLADLGYDEYAEGDGLTVVEWADRMSGALMSSMDIDIEPLGGEQRRFHFAARDDRGADLLGQLVRKWTSVDVPA